MKTIIAGSRGITRLQVLEDVMAEVDWEITEVVSGGARGADRLGEQWARKNGIPIKQFIPDWSTGRSAGHVRNRKMGDYADALVALWDGESRGTKGMIEYAIKKDLKILVWAV